MRLIMMGTGPFAVPTFQSLLDSTHEVAVLVTRPSATLQTHGKTRAARNPMREVAEARGIEVLTPENVNTDAVREQLLAKSPDLFVVCDYGQILAANLLAAARFGGINLHASLLPRYRGAAPINWAIWCGESETGVTVLHMTPRLDAGPSLIQVRTAIGPDETAGELEQRLSLLGVQPVHDAIAMLANSSPGAPLGVPQDNERATRAPRLKKSDGRVDWSQTAVAIYRQFRALQPWPGLFTYMHVAEQTPFRVLLGRVRVRAHPQPVGPGRLVALEGRYLLVGTAQDCLAIERLQPAGKRLLDAEEFLRGYRVQIGDWCGDESTS